MKIMTSLRVYAVQSVTVLNRKRHNQVEITSTRHHQGLVMSKKDPFVVDQQVSISQLKMKNGNIGAKVYGYIDLPQDVHP